MPAKNKKLTRTILKRLTDERSWERGEAYFDDGAVYALLEDGDAIRARVRGQRTCRVRLCVDDGEWGGECSCPMGDAGVFCKHCVAVGLACIDAGLDPAKGAGGRGNSSGRKQSREQVCQAVSLDDLRHYLLTQRNDELVHIVMEQAMEDDRLRESLLMKVARQQPDGPNLVTFRDAIDSATDTGGFVDQNSAYGFARGIDNLIDSIAQLLKEGHADAVIELSERALERCEDALGMMEDSDGEMTSLLERIQEMHHAACVAAKPDPVKLAHRLFDWEMTTDWDTFYGAAEAYADVLESTGLTVYRQLAESAWKGVPSLGPGDDRRSFESSRFRLTSIMGSLARADGDVEALVAVKCRDLSSPYAYLQVAEIYQEAGAPDKALRWAEDGIEAFPNRPDERLFEFVANEYHRQERHDDAMALIWANFVERPYLHSYEELKRHATRAKAWNAWREKAISHIRTAIRETRRESANRSPSGIMNKDHSALVEILLWEKKPEKAWEEAKAGGCDERFWIRLAKLREKLHPADSLEIYRRQVEPIINHKNKDAYREAVAMIKKVGELMRRVGRSRDFPAYVASIRDGHRRKRNLIALLDRVS